MATTDAWQIDARLDNIGIRIDGSLGNDRLAGSTANDSIYGSGGNDILAGGLGNDRIVGGSGTDTAVFFGVSSDYFVNAIERGLRVVGPDGTDTLIGIERIATDDGIFAFNAVGGGWEKISNTPGQALLAPGQYVKGTSDADVLLFRDLHKAAVLDGFAGNDDLSGSQEADLVRGGRGADFISGDAFGGIGVGRGDRLYGGRGNDTIRGDAGSDQIHGGRGADEITGGIGDDTISGGAGKDTFAVKYVFDKIFFLGWGDDVITDFQVGIDGLILDPGNGADYELRSNARGEAVIQLVTSDGDGPGTITLAGVGASGLSLDDLLA